MIRISALVVACSVLVACGGALEPPGAAMPAEPPVMEAKDGVPFPRLFDSKLVAHEGFNVVHVAGEEELKKRS